MAHLHKKIKNGRSYYYIRETQRIDGKPTVVNQVYLGSADRILTLLGGNHTAVLERLASKEFGALWALHQIDRDIDLAALIDDQLPAQRASRGPSLGQMLYYTVLNRAIAPKSKRQLATWYEQTDIQHIRPVQLKALSPQRFWNHCDRITEAQLETLQQAFFNRIAAIWAPQSDQLLFDTTNYYTYLDSQTPSELAQRGYNKAGKHHLRQVGLALLTEASSRRPLAYWLYPGNQHDSRFFQDHLDAILGHMQAVSPAPPTLTLVFDKGMNSEATFTRLDEVAQVHFITSYSPHFAPELAARPLKQFEVLPIGQNQRLVQSGQARDQLLYLHTTAPFWGKTRHVVVIYNPKTFRKKRHELRRKLEQVRQVLYELRRKHREGQRHWRKAEAVQAHYDKLCEDLHLNPAFFDLRFDREHGQAIMTFHLNRYQCERHLRRIAKTLLITDHEDWSAAEIYQTYTDRYEIEPEFRQAKSPFHVALMPQYHWTDSKIRIHIFVCMVALTYLNLLRQRLEQGGISLSIAEAMASLRGLRTALYWLPGDRQPRRQLEEPTPLQRQLLTALGGDF
jgi:transposase